MLTKKTHEAITPHIQFEDLYSAANDIQTLAQSSELMSCGGMYLSPQMERLPLKNEIQVLTLPTYFPECIVLKNGSIYEELNSPEMFETPEEEKVEVGSSITVKKYSWPYPQ